MHKIFGIIVLPFMLIFMVLAMIADNTTLKYQWNYYWDSFGTGAIE